jgi:hypothetical protein
MVGVSADLVETGAGHVAALFSGPRWQGWRAAGHAASHGAKTSGRMPPDRAVGAAGWEPRL